MEKKIRRLKAKLKKFKKVDDTDKEIEVPIELIIVMMKMRKMRRALAMSSSRIKRILKL